MATDEHIDQSEISLSPFIDTEIKKTELSWGKTDIYYTEERRDVGDDLNDADSTRWQANALR